MRYLAIFCCILMLIVASPPYLLAGIEYKMCFTFDDFFLSIFVSNGFATITKKNVLFFLFI